MVKIVRDCLDWIFSVSYCVRYDSLPAFEACEISIWAADVTGPSLRAMLSQIRYQRTNQHFQETDPREGLISGFPMAQIRPLARRRGETAPTDTEFLPLPSSSAATG